MTKPTNWSSMWGINNFEASSKINKFFKNNERFHWKREGSITSDHPLIHLWFVMCVVFWWRWGRGGGICAQRPSWLACVQTITKLWLVPSAKQRRDPCSGPPRDSTNYRKWVSNSPSTWLAITTNKTKAFFNWPIVARTQIWVHSWKSRTRISALFRRRS